MKKFKNLYGRQKWTLILILLPIIFLGMILSLKTVNVPFWDQWELVPIIRHIQSGHFAWSDFWWQHNEHRIFFPQLLMVGVAFITHWNTVVECFIGLAVATSSFILILKLINKTTTQKLVNSTAKVCLVFLASLIWFSPVQTENWLWGWQMQWFMNVLGVTLVAYSISRIKNSTLSNNNLVLLLSGGILAEYSLGNGLLIWPITVAALLYLKVSWKKVVATTIIGLITIVLYYHHYINPTEPSKTLALHAPVSFVHYVLLYLGRPLSFLHKPATFFGFLLLITFITLSSYLFIHKRKIFNNMIPWIVVGLYAIASSFITGLARLGFGVNEAVSSRYTTISSLLLLSVLVMLFNSREVLLEISKKNYKFLETLTLSGITGLIFLNMAWGMHSAIIQSHNLKNVQQCTRLQDPSPACLLSTYPNEGVARDRLNYLKQIHWGGY